MRGIIIHCGDPCSLNAIELCRHLHSHVCIALRRVRESWTSSGGGGQDGASKGAAARHGHALHPHATAVRTCAHLRVESARSMRRDGAAPPCASADIIGAGRTHQGMKRGTWGHYGYGPLPRVAVQRGAAGAVRPTARYSPRCRPRRPRSGGRVASTLDADGAVSGPCAADHAIRVILCDTCRTCHTVHVGVKAFQ